MKSIIFIALVFILSSCGLSERMREDCGSDLEMPCNFLFGEGNKDLENKINEHDKRINDLEAELSALSNSVDDNYAELMYLIDQLETYTQQEDADLQQQINDLQIQINNQQTSMHLSLVSLTNMYISSQTQITTLNNGLTSLTTLVNTINGQLANTVTMIIDPCGDQSGYDEVILKTRAGEYLAYFENGNKRFLTRLVNGNYVTTDGTNCHFSVNGTNLSY